MNDTELKNVFIEGQMKLQELSRQRSMVTAQLNTKDRERKIASITNKELVSLGDNVKTYKSVGKMFIESDLSTLTTELTNLVKSSENETKALERAFKKIELDIKDQQTTLKEMLDKRG
ncbi:hypothetical protein HK099_007946 [Clydaea vesicula]|uniref:Prefoldin subunit 1 n=1 Tax=Clydaea vesicula TaxID=447962 RepID=A0AAD5U594_9FUNG|nr:hypothetical protein HK099_007946 [Clydaea vesicula]KAJ3384019.1 hypothetical protein HDU92_003805 [Lobulomyces angularis]